MMRGLKMGSTGTDYSRTVSANRQQAKWLGRTQVIELGLVIRTVIKELLPYESEKET